jgi:pimeloyl-ACP methyl ester carboxylesterase
LTFQTLVQFQWTWAVSLSLGGAVAVDLALAFRERVRSLTLIDAPLLGRPTGIRAWSEASALAKAGDLPGARDAWLRDPLLAPARARPGVLAVLREMSADYSGQHWCDRADTRFEVDDPAPRLGEISVPALVLVGEFDLPSFRATAETYAAALPRATSHVISGAGHLASLEAPEIVNDLLIRFLASA